MLYLCRRPLLLVAYEGNLFSDCLQSQSFTLSECTRRVHSVQASVLIIMPVESVQVVEDARNALWQVRQSLADLYASLAVDPHEPQSVARQF